MTKRILIVLVSLCGSLLAACGYEPLESIPEPEYEPICSPQAHATLSDTHFWFVQLTDIEQSRLSGSEIASYSFPPRGDYRTYLAQLRYIRNAVDPLFVVATGDLVYGGILRQVPKQWMDYRMAIFGACFGPESYYDLPGNHDVMYVDDFDLYESKSISGKTHYSWTYENRDRRYAFVAFNTSRPGKVDGYFTDKEREWLADTLKQHEDADVRLAFAHHTQNSPAMKGLFGENGVLTTQNVIGFFGGHIHKDSMANENGTLVFQTNTTYADDGGSKDGRFRIVSFDGDGFATRSKWILNHGPQVMITKPQDKAFSTSANPDGHIVSGVTQIHALAFSSDEISLSVYVGDDDIYSMEPINDRRFKATIDFADYAPGSYVLEVKADGYRPKDTNSQDAILIEVQ